MTLIKAVLSRLAAEPVLVSAVVSVLVTAGAKFGLALNADQVLAVFSAIAAVLGVTVRQLVAPLTKI